VAVKVPLGLAKGLSSGMGTGVNCGVGHGANSQFGPTRPTAVPSGQIITSSVQAVFLDKNPLLIISYATIPTIDKTRKPTANHKILFDFLGNCSGTGGGVIAGSIVATAGGSGGGGVGPAGDVCFNAGA